MRRFLVIVALATLVGQVACAGDSPQERKSLSKISRVYLGLTLNDKEGIGKKLNLTEDRLRTILELSMRKAGIQLVEKRDGDPPMLLLTVDLMAEDKGAAIFTTELALWQSVTLDGDPENSMYAVTWSDGGYGFAGLARAEVIRDQVAFISERFSNAFLASKSMK